ncbi:DUF1415 domain-containing protein [Marinobacterium rhizophilum]|uniref:DUF1415 domain-containing protein n=1 Tax=Marinobacterium rhizophilum TaxID=420402 RepID=A0ABY5HGW1_9GAMM|nr:DUF1415 domain-containing protein [Marinobacterium rhizophilum]UTW10848.1 DUF1415 domain-containing protein [Marinobacterium rhizophilum]
MNEKTTEFDIEQVCRLTRRWVEVMVVGENLCPFAASVLKRDQIRFAVSQAQDGAGVARDFLAELALIQQTPEDDIATTLLIVPAALGDFYDYLDALAQCEELITDAGLEGVFQLASFHPNYRFGGVPPDDISHWTNRSPYPMFHLLREGQMSRVLAHYPDPDAIPERNIEHLRALGREGLIARFPPFADYC